MREVGCLSRFGDLGQRRRQQVKRQTISKRGGCISAFDILRGSQRIKDHPMGNSISELLRAVKTSFRFRVSWIGAGSAGPLV